MPHPTETARSLIAAKGGTIRTGEALNAGIHPRTLYAMRDNGTLTQIARGLYRLTDLPPVGDPDLALVARLIPRGVVCLVSALAVHEITTQVPHEVHLAVPRTSRYPMLRDVPLSVHRFSGRSYSAGITEHDIGGESIRVYDAEKTIADCFKFRNKIGLDVVLESLAAYRRRRGSSMQRVLEYARVNRVATGIRPYLESYA